jgi:hypothetical protein
MTDLSLQATKCQTTLYYTVRAVLMEQPCELRGAIEGCNFDHQGFGMRDNVSSIGRCLLCIAEYKIPSI